MEEPSSSATIHEYPLVVDVDNDGNSEILVVANDTHSSCNAIEGYEMKRGVFVYGDVFDRWVGTRRVWTSHAYHVTNVTSAGNAPAMEVDNWTQAGLNNYRQNVQGAGTFNAPDLEVELQALLSECSNNALVVVATVRNAGALGVPAGVEATLFEGGDASGTEVGTQMTPVPLLPGQTTQLSWEVPVAAAGVEVEVEVEVEVPKVDGRPGCQHLVSVCLEPRPASLVGYSAAMRRYACAAAALLGVGAMAACDPPKDDPPKHHPQEDRDANAEPAEAAVPDPKVAAHRKTIEAFAVVAVGAQLYTHPSGPAAATVPSPAPGDASPGVSVRVAAQVDDKLEVHTAVDILALPGEVCGGRLSGIRDFHLRMYVDRSSLVRLTTEPLQHEFADGTSVKLIEGIPVVGSDPGPLTVVAAGTAVTLPMPADKLDDMYWPAPKKFAFFPREGELRGTKPLRYANGKTLEHAKLFHDYYDDLPYYAQTPKGKDVLVTVRNACLEAVVRTSPGQITKARRAGDRDRDRDRASTSGKAYKVENRAQVLWSDGSVAGFVFEPHVFEGEPTIVGDNRCWQVPVVKQAKPTLTLCFAQADVKDADKEPARVE